MKELRDRLAAIADEHEKRLALLGSALTPEIKAEIEAKAMDHAAQHFSNALGAGADKEKAMDAALDQAERHAKHLGMARLQHVDPSVKKIDLYCPVEKTKTPHALTVDHVGDTIATCACGRFKKYAKGVDVSEAEKQADAERAEAEKPTTDHA